MPIRQRPPQLFPMGDLLLKRPGVPSGPSRGDLPTPPWTPALQVLPPWGGVPPRWASPPPPPPHPPKLTESLCGTMFAPAVASAILVLFLSRVTAGTSGSSFFLTPPGLASADAATRTPPAFKPFAPLYLFTLIASVALSPFFKIFFRTLLF